jgi:hypothetical protein
MNSYPASEFCESIELIVGDEIRFEIFLPITDAEKSIVRVTVNVDGSTQVIRRPAVSFVNRDLFLIGI